jgi:deoxyribose-phosphate aldolase
MSIPLEQQSLRSTIEQTLLKPDTTATAIDRLCDEAAEHQFFGVCVNPCWVPRACSRLSQQKVAVVTVIGFPLGAHTAASKAREAAEMIDAGADELDMVLNLGSFLSGDEAATRHDIRGVVLAAGSVPVKLILETALLSPEQIARVSRWGIEEGVSFLKTSTGFSSRGASTADIETMSTAIRQYGTTASTRVQIKASGGIRSYETAVAMIKAGASRIGTSSGVAIIGGTAQSVGANY